MKSRITIDFAHDQNGKMHPLILIQYKESDDVRDSLLKSFIENSHRGGLEWVHLKSESYQDHTDFKYSIRPEESLDTLLDFVIARKAILYCRPDQFPTEITTPRGHVIRMNRENICDVNSQDVFPYKDYKSSEEMLTVSEG